MIREHDVIVLATDLPEYAIWVAGVPSSEPGPPMGRGPRFEDGTPGHRNPPSLPILTSLSFALWGSVFGTPVHLGEYCYRPCTTITENRERRSFDEVDMRTN